MGEDCTIAGLRGVPLGWEDLDWGGRELLLGAMLASGDGKCVETVSNSFQALVQPGSGTPVALAYSISSIKLEGKRGLSRIEMERTTRIQWEEHTIMHSHMIQSPSSLPHSYVVFLWLFLKHVRKGGPH